MKQSHNRKKIFYSPEQTVLTLNFIIDFTKERGYPPSVREVGEKIGVSSSATIHKFIRQCVDEGYIDIDARIPRSIRVSKMGKKYLSSAQ
jgi:repressor LexA